MQFCCGSNVNPPPACRLCLTAIVRKCVFDKTASARKRRNPACFRGRCLERVVRGDLAVFSCSAGRQQKPSYPWPTEIRDDKDNDLSYTVSATITLIPLSEQTTRVLVAANQTTEMHRKEYRWWKLLWILPIFPVGSEYTTVVVNRDTVRSPQFYQDLFAATKSLCTE